MGAPLTAAITLVCGWRAPISATAIASGFIFTRRSRNFFGHCLALQASRLYPIEALRYA